MPKDTAPRRRPQSESAVETPLVEAEKAGRFPEGSLVRSPSVFPFDSRSVSLRAADSGELARTIREAMRASRDGFRSPDRLSKMIDAGDRSVPVIAMVVAPMGAGKTRTFALLVQRDRRMAFFGRVAAHTDLQRPAQIVLQ